MGDHIYYARYLDLLEKARNELFRESGKTLLAWQQEGIIFPVIECHLRYRSPARYDDLLSIELWITQLQGVRITFACRILNQLNELVLEGGTAHVCTGHDQKLRRLPPALKELLERYLREETAEK